MEHGLLNTEDVHALRVRAQLSGVPVADRVRCGEHHVPCVAVHQWVLPERYFVILWMWVLMSGAIYLNKMDSITADAILLDLNPSDYLRNRAPERTVLDMIYRHVMRWLMREHDSPEAALLNDWFQNVMQELEELDQLPQAA